MQEPSFVIVPRNPYDTTPESLTPMIEALGEEDGATVAVRNRPERGYGVTLIEVVVIYIGLRVLDGVTDRIIERSLDKAESACTRWWAKRRLERKNRPANLLICDEDGNILRSLEYRPEEDAPVHNDPTQAEKRLPPPPS